MSLQELPTYFQFEFTARQRQILRAYRSRIQTRILSYQRASQENEDAADLNPLAIFEYQLTELARFSKYLDADQYQKVGLNIDFLPWLTQELEMDLDPQTEESDFFQTSRQEDIVPNAASATVYELLQLHYQLTRALVRHVSHELMERLREAHLHEAVLKRLQNHPDRHYIYTAGMDEVAVFTALYNSAKPQSRSASSYEESDITLEEGARLMQRSRGYIDYLGGRRMKISLDELLTGRLDVTNYDFGNGEGAAQKAIQGLPRV